MANFTEKWGTTILQLVPGDTDWKITRMANWRSISLLNPTAGDKLAIVQLCHGVADADCPTIIIGSPDGSPRKFKFEVDAPARLMVDYSLCTFGSPTTVGIIFEFSNLSDYITAS